MKSASALESALNPVQREWLTERLCSSYDNHRAGMGTWAADMAVYERCMEDNFEDRETKPDLNTADGATILARSNSTLGMVSGFVDFGYAQAKDDILGNDEWLAVNPVGVNDEELAKKVRRHAPWKLEKCGVLGPLADVIRLAPNLGTTFAKVAWEEIAETYEAPQDVLYHLGKPVTDAGNNLITGPLAPVAAQPAMPVNPADGAVLGAAKKVASAFLPGVQMVSPEGHPEIVLPASEVELRESFVEKTVILKSGVSVSVIDYNDIVFDRTAPELDLMHTPVFHRFSIGLLDAKELFGMDEETFFHARDLAQSQNRNRDGHTRDHRGEQETHDESGEDIERSNPRIVLVEGYDRCDPMGTDSNVRIYSVFSPDLRVLFKVDYLANVTPKGQLPIFPLRWWRIPGRITGKGYWEVFGEQNDDIDVLHNAVTWRDRLSNQPITGYNKNALADPTLFESPLDLSKPIELAEGKTMADLFSFAVIPDNNSRSIELMNQKLQMGQMRTGITSAAQGELKGVPSANTATGTNEIISRGAVLLKWPITDLREDAEKLISYGIHLLYANQNTDETFTWGEGNAREIISLKADQVANLDFDVTFALSQTQNRELLENGMAAIQHVMTYMQVPEPEKASVRPMFVQVLNALGFRNAEQIIREPILLPPAAPGLPPGDGSPVPMDDSSAPV